MTPQFQSGLEPADAVAHRDGLRQRRETVLQRNGAFVLAFFDGPHQPQNVFRHGAPDGQNCARCAGAQRGVERGPVARQNGLVWRGIAGGFGQVQDVARTVFESDDIFMLLQRPQSRRRQCDVCVLRYVIEQNRHRAGLGDGLEMLLQNGLRHRGAVKMRHAN